MKQFLFTMLAIVFISCGNNDSSENSANESEKNVESKNPAQFNTDFATLLNNYYHLKDGLVLSNDSTASTVAGFANLLASNADSLIIDNIAVDSLSKITAKTYLQSISADAKSLVLEKDLEEKRKSFSTITESMYELIRIVRYDQQKVYYINCPMAFNDKGANWLNNTDDIKNPYFGKKMLTCGVVNDSLDYRGK